MILLRVNVTHLLYKSLNSCSPQSGIIFDLERISVSSTLNLTILPSLVSVQFIVDYNTMHRVLDYDLFLLRVDYAIVQIVFTVDDVPN